MPPVTEQNDRPDLTGIVSFAESCEAALFGRGQMAALDSLQAESGALMNALDEAQLHDRPAGVRIAIAIWRFWLLRGRLAEGRARLARLLEDPAVFSLELYVRGLTVQGIMAFFQGDPDAAAGFARQSLPIAEEINDPWSLAFSRTVLGWAAQAKTDYASASTFFREGLSIFRRMGHRWGEAVSLLNLGEVARSLGDLDSAAELYKQDLAIYRELEEASAIAATLSNLGFVALRRREPEARAYFAEALDICGQLKNNQFAAGVLVGFAGLAAGEMSYERAFLLISAADALLSGIDGTFEPAEQLERERILESVKAALGDERLSILLQEPRTYTMEEAVSLALS
ncbi:MAG TPA: tetratricopeptide repeat protein [Blastocatellia bacterium]|jgi:tetratricopeptide (TPR) repeat protein|nr:tetratricopeptide repeat protein [Blastocatellia bacterium]